MISGWFVGGPLAGDRIDLMEARPYYVAPVVPLAALLTPGDPADNAEYHVYARDQKPFVDTGSRLAYRYVYEGKHERNPGD